MPEKIISQTELAEYIKDGGLLEYDEPVQDLSEIVEQLKALVLKKHDDSRVLMALEKLTEAVKNISVNVEPVDLSPVLQAVRLIKKEMVAPIQPAPKQMPWRFKMERDNRGNLLEVVALPIKNIEELSNDI